MSKLAVANIIFETTEANRIEYTGNNVVRVRANGGLQIPFGTTAQRVSPEYGIIRYNTDLQTVEMYDAGGWYNMPTGGYVNSIYTVANSAYAAANNVGPQIAPAFNQANLAYTSSNVVYAAVNSAFGSINSNWTVTNTVYGVANAAYGAANNVGPQIAPAYNTANAAFTTANTKFSSSGGTISGAVEITADLTVHGNTRFVDQQTLQVGDPLIYLAANNYASDVVDIGFVANYVNATSSNVHTGLFRSSGTKEYYLFQGYDKEPYNNYIDPTGNNITMAVLNSTVRTSNLILGGANTINWITSAYASINSNWTVTNTVYGVANAAFGKSNTALQNGSVTLAGSLTTTGSLTSSSGSLTINGSRPLVYNPNLGTLSIQGDTGGWATGFYAIGSSGTNRGGFGFLGGVDALSYYWIGASYDAAAVFVTAANNVGIGTSSPGQKLEVVGNAKISPSTNGGLLIYENGGSIQGFLGPSGFGGFAIGTQSSNNVILFAGNTERMRIEPTQGNISLNTGGYNYPWATSYQPGIDFGYLGYGSISCRADYSVYGQNIYMNSAGNWAYKIANQYGYSYVQSGGNHNWNTATNTGAAGANASMNTLMYLDASGNLFPSSSVRAPIFYDSNDTGYYINPNSSSYLYYATFATGYAGNGSTIGGTAGSPVLYSNGQTSRAYEAHDFNTYPNLYSTIFCNISASSNTPTGILSNSMGYRFVMGSGDTAVRGFDLVGTSGVSGTTGELFFRERATGTWNKTWHNNNAPGTVLQVQSTAKTSTTSIAVNGNSWNEFDSAFRVTITPKSSSSKILISAHITGAQNTGTVRYKFQYSTNSGSTWNDVTPIGDAVSTRSRGHFGYAVNGDTNQFNTCSMELLHSPATTSAIIYRIQFGQDVTTTYHFNRSINYYDNFLGGTMTSIITAKEIAA